MREFAGGDAARVANRGGGKRGSGERGARAGAETGREKPIPLDSRFCLFLLERLDSTVGSKKKNGWLGGFLWTVRVFLLPRDVERRMPIFYLDLGCV